ncbi:MAG TPA: DUF6114 domain-containing protein [Thermoplasmata archaeon]|nr:DUF6114 domain-containing protein [Thermoplasmata archaeon]
MIASRRPVLAAVLTVVGGAFVLAGGLVLWVIGTVLAHEFGLSSPLFVGGVVLGLLTMALGGLMGLVPRARRLLGALALACAVASIPLAFGGFVVGFVLTAIGGAIAVARPPRRVVVVTAGSPSGPSPPWT